MASEAKNARYKRVREDFRGTYANSSSFSIGEGAFACVLVARDQITGEVVALKRQRAGDESAREDLQHQVALQAHPHANVLSMRDFFFARGPTMNDGHRPNFLYTVHEFMGQTLGDMVKQRFALFSRREAASVFAVLCQGVAHLHAHARRLERGECAHEWMVEDRSW